MVCGTGDADHLSWVSVVLECERVGGTADRLLLGSGLAANPDFGDEGA